MDVLVSEEHRQAEVCLDPLSSVKQRLIDLGVLVVKHRPTSHAKPP